MVADQFGITKLNPTREGGREYYSNWHLPTTTSHQWDSAAQSYGQLDPQDSMADLIAPTTCRAIVDADTDTLQADTNADRNSWRYYIKDPAATEVSSPWKWEPSVEMTIYYKAIADIVGSGSIQVHCRLMGPTEHWVAISHCASAGHEYAFEIKKNKTIQIRKEVSHPNYAENKISNTADAPYNVWVGMKFIQKKLVNGNMQLECYRDMTDGLNGGTWTKVVERIDAGDWTFSDQDQAEDHTSLSSGSGNCTKVESQTGILNFPGTACGIRCDNTRVQFKKFSIREIQGDSTTLPPTSPGGGSTGGPAPKTVVEYFLSGGSSNTNKALSLGGVRSSTKITSGVPTNLFANIPANDTVIGKVYYRCFYLVNTHVSETAKACSFFMQNGTPNPSNTKMEWGLGTAPINGTEQGPFADQFTSPANIVWLTSQNSAPTTPNIGDLLPLQHKSIWNKLTLFANSTDAKNDNSIFLTRGTTQTGGSPAPAPDPDPGTGGGTTPPPTPSAFNMVAVGDWDMTSMTKKVVASMESENPEWCLDCGDHAYGAGQSTWLTGLKSLKAKFIPTVGNHDSTSTVLSQFNVSAIPFSVDKENVHILSLNTEQSMGAGSNQRAFVKADLAAARANPNIDWIILIMHKPFYTANSDHNANENGQLDAFGADMDTYKVDLVLQGHNHNMQRTFPVKFNPSSKLNPIKAQEGNGPYRKGDGTIFCISGGGGHDSGSSLYSIDSHPAYNAFEDDSHNGYMTIEFSGVDNNIMVCKFKDENGDDLHSFQIG
jgi:predicted phosphodiesterase